MLVYIVSSKPDRNTVRSCLSYDNYNNSERSNRPSLNVGNTYYQVCTEWKGASLLLRSSVHPCFLTRDNLTSSLAPLLP